MENSIRINGKLFKAVELPNNYGGIRRPCHKCDFSDGHYCMFSAPCQLFERNNTKMYILKLVKE